MALKAKTANKPVIDENGYVVGTIKNVLEIEERVDNSDKKNKYSAQFEFIVIGEGSVKPITYRFWTGQILNSEKFGDSQDYNRLTRLSLQLGLIQESDLDNLEKIDMPDFEELEGLKIKFKLEKSQKSQGLSVISIPSIESVK
jgi:hypothetical protein